MTETERIQNATAVIEVVKRRITVPSPYLGLPTEIDVVDSLIVLPKETQKTFFAAEGDSKYKWVQVVAGVPAQAFDASQILVIP